MGQKSIFLDIDGTLTEPGKSVPPDSALEAIARARAAGNKVFLCTGRNLAMLRPLLAYGFDGAVASAGGYILCGDEVIYNHPMPPEDVAQAMEVLRKSGVYRTVECLDGTFTDTGLDEFLSHVEGAAINSEMLRWREAMAKKLNMVPMEEYAGQPVYKIGIMCNTQAQLNPARALLEDRYHFCIQSEPGEHCTNGELIGRSFDKGRGILRVCEHLHLPLSDTYGFGDSMNDLEMFRTVGTSVCMANGNPRLKKEAHHICPAVTDDGLYQAFERLQLFH